MERFYSEQVKEELVRSAEVSLQNFVEVKEANEDRLEIDIKYCDSKLSVLFYLESPLDFLITNQDLLNMEYFDDKDPQDFSDTGVAEVVKWLVSHVKKNMMSKLEFYPSVNPLKDCIEDLQKDNVIEPGSYEISVKSDRVILILRFENDYEIHNLMSRTTTQQFYLIKLTFKTENGHLILPESKVRFSSSLILAFPDLNRIKIDENLQKKSVSELIRSIKKNVNAELSTFYEAWIKRKELLLRLQDIFSNTGASVTVDLVTMLKLQIGFQLSTGNYVLEMDLVKNFPKSCPKLNLTRARKDNEDDQIRVNEITGIMTPNMTNVEIVDETLKLMEALFAKFN